MPPLGIWADYLAVVLWIIGAALLGIAWPDDLVLARVGAALILIPVAIFLPSYMNRWRTGSVPRSRQPNAVLQGFRDEIARWFWRR
jgi:hypothetical protein